MKRTLFASIILLIVAAPSIFADRGSIPFDPTVRVFEPDQNAFIAWNGNEEIMILSTNMRSTDSVQVLEILPLPSHPVVTEGDAKIFNKATSLINRKLQMLYAKNVGRMIQKGQAPQAGQVHFHEQIGAHDIAVAEVKDKDGFVEWVNNYLLDAKVENPEIPDDMKSIVEEYLKEDYKWFVFDVIDLSLQPKTNEAIQYRFKTDHLYYPLKISKTEAGLTNVKLFVLTKDLLKDFPGYDYDKVVLMHDPVQIGVREVLSLSKEINQLFGSDNELLLRQWQLRGRLSAFDKDLIAK